jgi:hypothetical protein
MLKIKTEQALIISGCLCLFICIGTLTGQIFQQKSVTILQKGLSDLHSQANDSLHKISDQLARIEEVLGITN